MNTILLIWFLSSNFEMSCFSGAKNRKCQTRTHRTTKIVFATQENVQENDNPPVGFYLLQPKQDIGRICTR